MSDRAGFPGASDEEIREREAVYDGWWRCKTLEDVEEQERLADRYAERNPGMVDRSDAAIAREQLSDGEATAEPAGPPPG